MITPRATISLTTEDYPSDFPCPSMGGYSFTLKHDISETKMQNGWSVRRQREPYPRRTAIMTFRMSTVAYNAWYAYVMENAYEWIRMPVQTNLTTRLPGPAIKQEVLRFISNISYSYSSWSIVEVSVEVEFYISPTDGGTAP